MWQLWEKLHNSFFQRIFTTFSAFSLETALMIEKSKFGQAFGYATASVVLSVAALFAGLILARRVFA